MAKELEGSMEKETGGDMTRQDNTMETSEKDVVGKTEGANMTKIKCEICGATFKSADELAKHNLDVHGKKVEQQRPA